MILEELVKKKEAFKGNFFSFCLINVYPKKLVFPQLSVKTLTKFCAVQYFNIMVYQMPSFSCLGCKGRFRPINISEKEAVL